MNKICDCEINDCRRIEGTCHRCGDAAGVAPDGIFARYCEVCEALWLKHVVVIDDTSPPTRLSRWRFIKG